MKINSNVIQNPQSFVLVTAVIIFHIVPTIYGYIYRSIFYHSTATGNCYRWQTFAVNQFLVPTTDFEKDNNHERLQWSLANNHSFCLLQWTWMKSLNIERILSMKFDGSFWLLIITFNFSNLEIFRVYERNNLKRFNNCITLKF